MLRRSIVVLGLTGALASPPTGASDRAPRPDIRTITTAPLDYAHRAVTVRGQFRGRSRVALPPLNRSRWDFVLSSADAAIWISGMRPAGWDFDLDPASQADARAGRWLEVTGTVRVRRHGRPCQPGVACPHLWIEATDIRHAPAATAGGAPGITQPPVQTPKVVFHDPVPDESNVPRSIAVRLQFSRHMIAETFSEHVRVSYAVPRTLAAPPIPKFSAAYRAETRSLEIRFVAPLDPLQTVKVELLDGIAALNGRPLDPWAFTFTTSAE